MSPRVERVAAGLAKRWVGAYARVSRSRTAPERVREVLDYIDDAAKDERYRPLRRAARIVGRSALSAPSDLGWAVRARRSGTVLAPPPGLRFEFSRRSRPRAPGLVYSVLAVALVCIVATLTLSSRRSAPPTIAEFAPQAVEQIAETGDGSAGGQTSATGRPDTLDDEAAVRPSLDAVDVARVRRCVGDPPRQIEDPQAPPCVPYWSGDNGGATSRGVGRDEIRVADPNYAQGPSEVLASYFNRRFEFYGRRIRLIPVSAGPDDSSARRAAARAVYDEHRAFASIGPFGWGHLQHYLDELARYQIISVYFLTLFPETYMASRRPYVWMYPMANDRMFAAMGDWYCARFAKRDAVHAGDPVLQRTQRKPGIILTDANWEGTSVEPMNERLAACGERTDAVVTSSVQGIDAAGYAAFMENAMLQMKTSGVTTVTCLCWVLYTGVAMRAATNQAYFPEWLLNTFIENDLSANIRLLGTPEQMRNMMQLRPRPMERPQPDHPANWAVQEMIGGPYPTSSGDQNVLDLKYQMLLVLASGFQLAGPNLTPETFERGLHGTRFPNPPHPIMAGAVGFNDGDHTMTDDFTEMWWSTTARSPYRDEGAGALCYVDAGARRRPGAFPTDDPFFSGPCHTGSS